MNKANLYKWWAKHGGMDVSPISRMKEMDAEAQMQNDVLKFYKFQSKIESKREMVLLSCSK